MSGPRNSSIDAEPAIDQNPRIDSIDDLRSLYQIEHDGLVRLAFLLTGSQATAEEAVHDAFITLYEHRQQAVKPGAYLRQIVVNNCRGRQRRQATEQAKLKVVAGDPLRRTIEHEPEIAEIWRLVESLNANQRAVVVLRFHQDCSLAEIADTLNMNIGTVKSTLHRSLHTLRKELS